MLQDRPSCLACLDWLVLHELWQYTGKSGQILLFRENSESIFLCRTTASSGAKLSGLMLCLSRSCWISVQSLQGVAASVDALSEADAELRGLLRGNAALLRRIQAELTHAESLTAQLLLAPGTKMGL